MFTPVTPRPHRPVGRRVVGSLQRWLGKLGRADIAIGPAELGAIYLVFFLSGWSIGGTFGGILQSMIGGLGVLICRVVGAIIALFFVKPVRSIRARWGYLGIAGAILLAVLVSYGTGAVGQIVVMSKKTVTVFRMERGDTDVAAKVCIFEAQYDLGLLSREETDDLCGYETDVRTSVGGEETVVRYWEVPKPHPLKYVLEVVKLLAVVGILVFIFKRP